VQYTSGLDRTKQCSAVQLSTLLYNTVQVQYSRHVGDVDREREGLSFLDGRALSTKSRSTCYTGSGVVYSTVLYFSIWHLESKCINHPVDDDFGNVVYDNNVGNLSQNLLRKLERVLVLQVV